MKKTKMNIFSHTIFLMVPIFFILQSIPVFSQEDLPISPSADDALEEELRYLKAETYVITASRIPETIKKSASSITVVTDRQIRQMGARNLVDVMKTVPGMNYFYAYTGIHCPDVRYTFNSTSSRVLVMINSHPLNENYHGSAFWTHDTLALDNVKRIEFVKGPGSALYGANAFGGVINIITKEAEDIDGWEVIARGGSYDTQQYNLLYGKIFNDLEIVFNYDYFDTHGFNGHVNEDMQTSYDRILLRNASLAPGRMRGDDEKHYGFLSLKYKGFTLEGNYIDRERDFVVGILPILSDGYYGRKEYYVNLSYERTFWEKVDVTGKVYRNHSEFPNYRPTFPPGSVQFTPLLVPVIMPKGIIERFSAENDRTGFEIHTKYQLSNSNTIVGGITYEEMKQYDVSRRANYLATSSPYFIIPLFSMRDLTHRQNRNRSVKRNFKAFFIEDIWDITDDLRLTVGVRYDDYSDFGSEVSPRAGLTWEFIKGYDLKLLYGHAFRAPGFWELYDLVYGNPNLDPETIDTYEISLGAEFTPSLSSRVTWFRSKMKDSIQTSLEPGAGTYLIKNYRTFYGSGLEFEMRYDFGRGTYLAMNYNYFISPIREGFLIPRYRGNIMTNIRLSKYLNFYASCHFEDGFRRVKGDNRDDMSGYGIVNTTLIVKKFLKGYENLELRGSIYNLFDRDYTSPAEPDLPEDMPRPGRNFMIEVKYKF